MSYKQALLVAVFAIWGLSTVQAGEKVSAASGNWGTIGTWSPSGVPALNDNVTIANGHTVTVAAAISTAIPNNLTINAGGQLTVLGYAMTINGATLVNGYVKHTSVTGVKNFIGDVTINSGGLWEETAAAVVTFGGNVKNDGALTASSGAHTFSGTNKTISGTSGISIPSVTISGSYQNDGTLSVATALAGTNTLTQGSGAILNLGGTSALTYLNALANVNSVNYTGAAQTVKATPYYNLTLANSGGKTLTGVSNIVGNLTLTGTVTATTATNLVVGGNLTVASGTLLTVAGFPITVTGTTFVSGSLLHNNATGLKTYLGDVTINSGGGWTGSVSTIEFSFGGNLVNNGSLTANTNGVHTFTGLSKAFSGANPIVISRVAIDGTYQNSGTLIVSNALAGAGTLTQGEGAQLTIGGPTNTAITLATLNASDNANTVNYTGGTQTVGAVTYRNLTLTGRGAKTLTGVTVNGVLSMEGTATATVSLAYGPSATLQYNTATALICGPEWVTPFGRTGGVIITNTGTITLNADKVIGTSVPLAIKSGATLASGNFKLTLGGIFSNNGTFTAGEGTVELNANGPQSLPAGTYYNAIFSGTGAKSIVSGTAFTAGLSIAPSGNAMANIGDGLNIGVGILTLGGVGQNKGTWGSSSATSAAYHNNTFFTATTGYLTVFNDTQPNVVTWRGNGDWFADTGNWANGIPGPGSNVWIASGTVMLTNVTPLLAEITFGTVGLTNTATLIFTNWTTILNASNVTVLSNGVMSLPSAFSTNAGMSNRIYVVCTNFTMGNGATIDASGKGYLGRYRAAGFGLGGGSATPSGGGHGGMGLGVGPGEKYDSASAPIAPGSAGGVTSGGGAAGGNGGGAVFIDASGAVSINGTINANATAATAGDGGGGSGGSIYIRCRTFAGENTGLLTSKGGGPAAYAGGGGRIAVAFNPVHQAGLPVPQVRFNTLPGAGYLADGMGSLYLPDSTWMVAPFLNFAGTWFLGGITNWASDSLAPSNSIGFGETNFSLLVTNDLVLDGAISLGLPAYSQLHCSNLILTNGGSLTVYSGLVPTPTNVLTATNYGALVNVSNLISLATNSWIYPYSLFYPYAGVKNTNGSSVLFASSNVTIAAGAGFDANGKGHPGGTTKGANAWGNGSGGGSGRGWGASTTGGDGSGGSHGGRARSDGGGIYGSSNAPTFPGSGGGAGWTGSGAAGGGSVRIQAVGTVEVNGTIMANGGTQIAQSCGGSGGSIFIAAKTFKGASSASLMANGTDSDGSKYGGAGGRIAVAVGLNEADVTKLLSGQTVAGLFTYVQHSDFQGTISVTNGVYQDGTYPQIGTALFETVAGSSHTLSIVGSPATFGIPAPLDYGTYLDLADGTRITNTVVTPAEEANGLRRACIGWVLRDTEGGWVDSNTTTQAVFDMTGNRILTWLWTNEYQLIVRETTGGTVNSNLYNGWYTNGMVVSGIAASANSGYTFAEWVDDVSAASRYNTSINLIMDQPRTATASFYSQTGETRVWSGAGFWENSANWTPSGMAGPLDTAILRSGTSILSRARTVDSLTISNAASLMFTNWTTVLTGNTVMVRSGGRIELAPAFTNGGMSNRIYIVCQMMTIQTNAQVNATAKGYAGSPNRGTRGSGPGWGDSYSGGSGGGGSYGGQGGYSAATLTAGGGIYGDTNAPLAPGSGGGTDWSYLGGAGGGAIRLIANSAMILDGSILANGQDLVGGGGSGGSIYITCGTFSGGNNALLSARGGNSGSGNGGAGGGGGRIVVHYGGGRLGAYELYPEDFFGGATVTNGTGFASNSLPGTIKWFGPASRGTIFAVW